VISISISAALLDQPSCRLLSDGGRKRDAETVGPGIAVARNAMARRKSNVLYFTG
jgi:hypothetical protein